jgi:hypothetical protein
MGGSVDIFTICIFALNLRRKCVSSPIFLITIIFKYDETINILPFYVNVYNKMEINEKYNQNKS